MSAALTAECRAIATPINREHQLARQHRDSAIEHAIRCGQMLADVKAGLPHGQFGKWIEAHCDFAYSTAARYLKASKQKSTGVEISTLSSLVPSGHLKEPQPWLNWTAPAWMPKSGELVVGAHRYQRGVHIFVQPSEKHPGHYHAVHIEDLDDGAIAEGSKRPAHGWLIAEHLMPRWGGVSSFDWERRPADSDLWAKMAGGAA
jgi:hypothetical protein